jgi:flagellar biosynthesis anti-sigma factor FlgM
MRVDFTNFGREPAENSKPGRVGQNKAAGNAAGVSGGTEKIDQTSLSSDRVQSLAGQVLAQPEIREAKVEALRQSLASGEYSTSSSQVAEAMANELDGETNR